MDIIVADKDDVIRLELVRFPLNRVLDISFQKNCDLIKVMIVIFKFLGSGVRQVKQAEIAV